MYLLSVKKIIFILSNSLLVVGCCFQSPPKNVHVDKSIAKDLNQYFAQLKKENSYSPYVNFYARQNNSPVEEKMKIQFPVYR
jgi:hypothetical protein